MALNVVTVFFLLAVLVAPFTCTPDPLPDTEAARSALIAAERAFAATSVSQGQRTAFLEYLAEEAIIFNPMPTDGRAVYTERPETPTTLAWQPVFADIADTGDMGYTTGPWTYSDSSGTAVAFGHYISVWRLQPDSTWRVEIDAGIRHAKPAQDPSGQVLVQSDTVQSVALRKLYQEAARVALLRTDRELAVMSESEGTLAAFETVLTDSIRVYRDGSLPSTGKAAMVALLARHDGMLTWRPISGAVSQAGDLGYTYGLSTFRSVDADTTTLSSTYLRIWEAQPDSTWNLVLDLAASIPVNE